MPCFFRDVDLPEPFTPVLDLNAKRKPFMTKTELGGEAWWWIPQRMMSNSVPECEKDNLTGYVSFYTQWIDICVCIRVRGLHLFFPRVRTPCGHVAQVIVEGREEQSDGGEKNKETQHHAKPTKHHNQGPTGRVSTIM